MPMYVVVQACANIGNSKIAHPNAVVIITIVINI